MANLDDLRRQIEGLRADYAALSGRPAALFDVNNIDQANAAIQSLEDGIDAAKRKAADLEAGFGGISEQLKAITNELGKQPKEAEKVTRAYKGSQNIAEKLKYDQQGILDLNKKDLENIAGKLKTLKEQAKEGANQIKQGKELEGLDDKQFEARLKYLKNSKLISEEEEAILRAQREGFPVLNELIDKNKERLKLENEVQKSLGLSGDIAKLVGKIPGVGDAASEAFSDVEKKVKKIAKEGGEIPSKFETMKMFAEKFGEIIVEKINDPLATMVIAFKTIGESIKVLDANVVQFQKSMGLSYGEARELRKELSRAALLNKDNLINTRDLVKAQGALNNLLGIQGELNEDNLITQSELTKLLGISEQSAAKLQYFAEATGADFQEQKLASYEITSQVSSQYGVQVNQQKVMEEVGKQSAYTLAQFKGSTTALTEAISKAQALGTSLDTVNQIAGSLLNFESSISAELEAELLTGKQINLERARYFALTNNISGLMDEINDQMGDFSDFQQMNVIQQQAFAQALGMNVGQLSDMLLMEQYRGRTYEEIAALEGEDVAKRVENLTIQEKFNESITKMKDMFLTIAEGPLGTVAGLISSMLSNTEVMVPLLGIAAGYLTAMAVRGAIATAQFITRAVAAIFSGNAKFGPAGIISAAAGVTAMIATIAAAKASVPQAQFGAEVLKGGNVMVGEVGPEIVSLPTGAKVNPLPVRERRDLQPQQTAVQNDNKEMLQALTNMNQRMVEQQRAMSNMRIVLSTNAVEAGLVQNTAKIQ